MAALPSGDKPMRSLRTRLIGLPLLAFALAPALAGCAGGTVREPVVQERVVSGTGTTAIYGGSNPQIGNSVKLCASTPASYTVEEPIGIVKQRAIENWSWQVAHDPKLGSAYSSWSNAASSGISCLPLGRNAAGLEVQRCTATGTPCDG